jgi:glycosyltransferase 2 family protein
MSKITAPEMPDRTKERLILLGIFLLLLYVVVPRIHNVSTSVESLEDVGWSQVALAVAFLFATHLFSAGMYKLLAVRRLRYWLTVAVQFANAFANRLLPAGLGGLAMNVRYLQKSGHTLPQAVAVAGANNTLGFLGHVVLLVFVLLFGGPAMFRQLHVPHLLSVSVLLAIAGGLVLLNALISRRLRQHVERVARQALRQLASYRNHPLRLAGALLCSFGLTICYVAVLFWSVWAVTHIQPSPMDIFVVFTFGVAAATATPTPGGLGGAEAGLLATLVAYGYGAAPALAAVLLYRLITYWLPLLLGFGVFVPLRKRYI